MPDLKLPPPVNDGGHAFPQPLELIGRGMSLRDYFAAKALQGMMAYCNKDRGDFHTNSSFENNAKYAYQQADAMLKAREQ
jgi:hypothetical protein